MKREIKFRAWHINEKNMLSWILLTQSAFDFLIYKVLTNQYDYEIMQFTGLHDKNRKEIYEGDIVIQEKWVSVGNYVPSHGVVKYKGVGFTCECFGDWKGSDADLNGNAVVIGNIYENPELLQP